MRARAGCSERSPLAWQFVPASNLPWLRASRIHRLREREGGRWGVSEVGGVEGCGGVWDAENVGFERGARAALRAIARGEDAGGGRRLLTRFSRGGLGDALETVLVDVGALVSARARRGAEELVRPVRLACRLPADSAHGCRRGERRGGGDGLHPLSLTLVRCCAGVAAGDRRSARERRVESADAPSRHELLSVSWVDDRPASRPRLDPARPSLRAAPRVVLCLSARGACQAARGVGPGMDFAIRGDREKRGSRNPTKNVGLHERLTECSLGLIGGLVTPRVDAAAVTLFPGGRGMWL